MDPIDWMEQDMMNKIKSSSFNFECPKCHNTFKAKLGKNVCPSCHASINLNPTGKLR